MAAAGAKDVAGGKGKSSVSGIYFVPCRSQIERRQQGRPKASAPAVTQKSAASGSGKGKGRAKDPSSDEEGEDDEEEEGEGSEEGSGGESSPGVGPVSLSELKSMSLRFIVRRE